MSRTCTFEPENFYHIYNRGTDKRTIFEDEADRWWFMHLLYHTNQPEKFMHEMVDLESDLTMARKETLVDIGAYCLMPNHFHLLVREKNARGISLFMKKLGVAYSMYFNAKYERTGRLFEGAFKAKHIDTDAYLQYVFAYIHLNPAKLYDHDWRERSVLRRDVLERVSKYSYSSTKELSATRFKYLPILNPKEFPIVNSGARDMKEMFAWWLKGKQMYDTHPTICTKV